VEREKNGPELLLGRSLSGTIAIMCSRELRYEGCTTVIGGGSEQSASVGLQWSLALTVGVPAVAIFSLDRHGE